MERPVNNGKISLWLLLGERLGDNAQIRALAGQVGLPYEEKYLRFNWLYHVPNFIKGPSLLTLSREGSSSLAKPWPDVVIMCGRKSVPVARWIKKKSGGRTKIIAIGRPRAPIALFDLVVTTPQYRLPRSKNVVELLAPLSGIEDEDLAHGRKMLESELDDLPKPLIAVLAGGDTSTSQFDPVAADRLGRLASTYARSRGGSLLVSTSPRTHPRAASALIDAITVTSKIHRWTPDKAKPNPYIGFLSLADEVIVTCDSASMLSDACMAQKPVLLFDVPMKARNSAIAVQHKLYRMIEDAEARGEEPSALGRFLRQLAYYGILTPPRNMSRLYGQVVANHKAVWLVDACVNVETYVPPNPAGVFDGLEGVVSKIRNIVSQDTTVDPEDAVHQTAD